jgi:hypothetical protein
MTGTMECPICYERLTKKKITLECKHQLCFDCAVKWIPHQESCPMCRTTSSYFSRTTRSLEKSVSIYNSLYDHFTDLLYILNRFPIGNEVEIFIYACIFDFHIIQNKDVWYRPNMQAILSSYKKYIRDINTALEEKRIKIHPYPVKIFQQILEM